MTNFAKNLSVFALGALLCAGVSCNDEKSSVDPEEVPGADAGVRPAGSTLDKSDDDVVDEVKRRVEAATTYLHTLQGRPMGPMTPERYSWGDATVDSLILRSLLEARFAKARVDPYWDHQWIKGGIDRLVALQTKIAEESKAAGRPYMEGAVFELNSDGAYESANANYVTNLCAQLFHLCNERSPDDPYKDALEMARGWIEGLQIGNEDDTDPSNRYYGSFGYDRVARTRGDLSNSGFAIEALADSGGVSDAVRTRAIEFLSRCQNDGETNGDRVWRSAFDVNGDGTPDDIGYSDDGGAFYMPGENQKLAGYSQREDGTYFCKSYGNMTYQLVKSYILLDLDRNDSRFKKAVDWVRANYTLEKHAGFQGSPEVEQSGVFYYYLMMSKTLYLLGERRFKDSAGIEHDWPREMIDKILSLQNPDGSVVNTVSEEWQENYPTVTTPYCIMALSYAVRGLKLP
ncbi:MAG: terpene cyclase/mutase family protein [Planctomycetes bacterium]|nr:terpene cyclase/mutase family protein [Planctomycetota bacterium]